MFASFLDNAYLELDGQARAYVVRADAVVERLGYTREELARMTPAEILANEEIGAIVDPALWDDALTARLPVGPKYFPDDEVSDMPEEQFVAELVREQLQAAMTTFNEREAYIVRHRMMSDEPETLQKIGETFRISRERARQIEKGVARRLHEVFRERGVEPIAAYRARHV